jgi:hypothetical protein
MTDARFPERWLNDKRVVRLSHSAFRTFVTTLTWSVANRTDGVLERDDLELIHGADERDLRALLDSGLWAETRDSLTITVFRETQTCRSELEALDNLRKRDREKKRRQRVQGGDADSSSPGTFPGTASPGNVPRDSIGEDRQDRTGRKDRHLEPAHHKTGLDVQEIEDGLRDYRSEYRGGPVPWDREATA